MAVRGYNTDVEIPDKMVANKSYEGSFSIILDGQRERNDLYRIATRVNGDTSGADGLKVTPKKPGVANFTMLASASGEYPLVFKLTDSMAFPCRKRRPPLSRPA